MGKAMDGIHNELQTGRLSPLSSLPLTWPYKTGLSGAAQICLAGLEQLELQIGWRKAGTDSLFDRLAEILKTKSIYKQELEPISATTINFR